MQRIAWCCVLFATPAVAHAGELFRCESAEGRVSYQDTPCANGSRLTKTFALPAQATAGEGRAPKEKAKRAKAPAKSTAKTPKAGAANRRPDTRSRQRQACADARAERERVLDGLALARTFEHLRSLDDTVQAACKGL